MTKKLKTPFTNVFDSTIKILNGMAFGLFATLVVGLLLRQLALIFFLPVFAPWGGNIGGVLQEIGYIAGFFLGPAIGVAIAHSLGAPALIVYSSIVTGAIGSGALVLQDGTLVTGPNEPVGALIAATVGILVGRLVSGKTVLDIIVVPFVTVISGGITGIFISPYISSFLGEIGKLIEWGTGLAPIIGGALIAVVMSMLMVLPTSSAALSIAIGLSGLSAGAALAGCCTQMIGFAVLGFRDNGFSGVIANGLGTPKLQMGNILKNPLIWLPNLIVAAILGPISILIFQIETSPIGAGMGTCGLVGQIATIDVMGIGVVPRLLVLQFILPAVLVGLLGALFRKKGWIKKGDLTLVK